MPKLSPYAALAKKAREQVTQGLKDAEAQAKEEIPKPFGEIPPGAGVQPIGGGAPGGGQGAVSFTTTATKAAPSAAAAVSPEQKAKEARKAREKKRREAEAKAREREARKKEDRMRRQWRPQVMTEMYVGERDMRGKAGYAIMSVIIDELERTGAVRGDPMYSYYDDVAFAIKNFAELNPEKILAAFAPVVRELAKTIPAKQKKRRDMER